MKSETDYALHLQLFGEAQVLKPKRAVALSPFQLAMVSLVFATGGISRPELIQLLWQSEPGPGTRHRVRQLIHSIGQKCEQRLFEVERDEGEQPDQNETIRTTPRRGTGRSRRF